MRKRLSPLSLLVLAGLLVGCIDVPDKITVEGNVKTDLPEAAKNLDPLDIRGGREATKQQEEEKRKLEDRIRELESKNGTIVPPTPPAPKTPIISVTINKLKIIDCADDDEDMNIRLNVSVKHAGTELRTFNRAYDDVYVEEETKIGNDSKCTFFAAENIEPHDADEIWVDVDLYTLDGDGLAWGGHHEHRKNAHTLKQGENHFIERKEHSSKPDSAGVYEIDFTITRQ